ncbi:MAG TPA: hypothetical protein VFA70_01980 [Dehalococcoidia bacterium]|nr:hypothetical protein [Dehalococcoidia bacterium]
MGGVVRRSLLLLLGVAATCYLGVRTGTAHTTVRGATLDPVGIFATGDPRALASAGVDWYVTDGATGDVPAGTNRAAIVRLTPAPDLNALRQSVAASPGSVWLIGSEPNVATPATSDDLSPADYATRLHDLAALIHGADPTALIVGPNVLNWTDTCTGCAGFPSGADWTQEFYDDYVAAYGERPPIDRWAVHTYELDWANPPQLHPEFDIRQLTDLRAWLDSTPTETGSLIWDTELGFHWSYPGFDIVDGNLVPLGDYDQAGVDAWLTALLSWLYRDAQALGVERAFFYGQAPAAEHGETQWAGLSLFDGNDADAALTPSGQLLHDFLAQQAPAIDN